MANQSFSYKNIVEKIKGIKNIEIIIAIVIIAIIVSIYGSTFVKPQEKKTNEIASEEKSSMANNIGTRDPTEEKLVKVLSSIDGAGQVEVMITYESGPELVPAMDTDKNDTNTEETDSNGGKRTTKTSNENSRPVTIQQRDGSQPLVTKEKTPEVRGVIVIAEGAKNIRVKVDLLQAVETVLKVPPDRVEVFSMGKK